MSATICYFFILSLWWRFNVTIYVRSFQLISLQWENWPNSPLVKRLQKFRTIFILGHCWKHIERPDMRLPDRGIEPFRWPECKKYGHWCFYVPFIFPEHYITWPVHPMASELWISREFGTLEGLIWDSQHVYLLSLFTPHMSWHLSLSLFSDHLNKVSFHKRGQV